MRPLWSLAAIFALGASALMAQDQAGTSTAPSPATSGTTSGPRNGRLVFPVLVFDRARVLANSQIGQDLETRIDEARAALLAENDRIYADLETEEKALSDIRNSLPEEEFRARAQAFDEKVVKVRAEQDAKGQDIQKLYDDGLTRIEQEMNQVLTGIARDFSAVLMFERGQVYLMSGAIDVSQIAIDRLDARVAAEETDGDPAQEMAPGDAQGSE